jgi:hypothetical protein
LTGDLTLTNGLANNQWVTVGIDGDTVNYGVTFTAVDVWTTDRGLPPELSETQITWVSVWRVGGVTYGARSGDA